MIFSGCGPKTFDSSESLWQYLKDPANRYHAIKSINGVQYSLTYKPTDLMVDQELGANATTAQIAKAREKYKSNLYFDIGISYRNEELLSAQAKDRKAFGTLVAQLSFGMTEKVHLMGQHKDTIQLLDYAYPRLYGMSNSTKMLMVYKRDQKILDKDYIILTIEDLGFGTGEVSFKMDAQKIKNEPCLTF